jgi:hypothetical protein
MKPLIINNLHAKSRAKPKRMKTLRNIKESGGARVWKNSLGFMT